MLLQKIRRVNGGALFPGFIFQDKTHIAMLVAWLSELWLNEIGRLKERGEEMSAKYEELQENLIIIDFYSMTYNLICNDLNMSYA